MNVIQNSSILRTGIDLVEVSRLTGMKEGIRQRFLRRVFTERELSEAAGCQHYLAGRFAAKEAIAKAFGSGIGLVGWKEIEILRGPQGEPLPIFGSKARALSEGAGITGWFVSISHTSRYALALTVAVGDNIDDGFTAEQMLEDRSNENPGSQ